jgi:adenine-specific DNA-methyltransferase
MWSCVIRAERPERPRRCEEPHDGQSTVGKSIITLEERRIELQARLDAEKTQAERNRLGQFATPPTLADEIIRYGVNLLPADRAVRFLDPAVGTGAFYSALRSVLPNRRIAGAVGFEIDPHYGSPAAALWSSSGLAYRIEDFTRAPATACCNLLICNPPYVRHHHLGNADKARLRQRSQAASGVKLSGLSGLYCFFLGVSHGWMEAGAVAGWLVPSEFMDVNYGQALKRYLLDRVTLLHVHRFDPHDTQFSDALVSSAVVWLRNTPAPEDHSVRFTFGGSLEDPRVSRSVAAEHLAHEAKWTRFPVAAVRRKTAVATLADFFRINRGLATGDNRYFILSLEQIAARGLALEVFRPILPSPRYLPTDVIDAHDDGRPRLERQLFLLDTKLDEAQIAERFPTLSAYLREGRDRGLHARYLCRHRSPWYSQERRPPAPIVCTYLGRDSPSRRHPFRFILNRSMATAANVYLLMYPTPLLAGALASDPTLIDRVWDALNHLTAEELCGEGRVYGGGLHKLEPRELANVPVPRLADLMRDMAALQDEEAAA